MLQLYNYFIEDLNNFAQARQNLTLMYLPVTTKTLESFGASQKLHEPSLRAVPL